MACGACSSRTLARSGTVARTLYQVVLDGGNGRTAFQTHDLPLARRVRDNYPGSTLVPPDPDAAPAATLEAADTTETDGEPGTDHTATAPNSSDAPAPRKRKSR
jgi:hypothetical protein